MFQCFMHDQAHTGTLLLFLLNEFNQSVEQRFDKKHSHFHRQWNTLQSSVGKSWKTKSNFLNFPH